MPTWHQTGFDRFVAAGSGGLAGDRPSRTHQPKSEGGAPRRRDSVIVATPFVTLVTLLTSLTLPWPTEALAKDATLLPWRSLRFLIQHCHRALVQGLRFLMRIANRSQPCSSQLSQSTHHVKD